MPMPSLEIVLKNSYQYFGCDKESDGCICILFRKHRENENIIVCVKGVLHKTDHGIRTVCFFKVLLFI